MQRLRRRLATVLLHSGQRLLVPLAGPVIAVFVLRLSGVALWGEFVRILVGVHLVAHVAGWGNREYLLRQFSRSPSTIGAAWTTALRTRMLLVCLGSLALLAPDWPLSQRLLAVLLALTMVASQSFEVFVVYRRAFAFALVTECVSLGVVLISVLAIGSALTATGLLGIHALSHAVKAMVLWRRFAADAGPLRAGRFDPSWLLAALPFFLLGVTGLLQSRADLYVVSWLRPADDIGRYQVYINLVVFLQSTAGLAVTPFVKGLYRLPLGRLLWLSASLTGLGLVVVAAGVPAMALLLRHVYGLDYAPGYYVAGALAVLPGFAYLPIIYALFKQGQPAVVVAVNAFGLAVSLVLMWQWLPHFGILGAAWSAAAAQWAMLAAYAAVSSRLPRGNGVPLPNLP